MDALIVVLKLIGKSQADYAQRIQASGVERKKRE
jgi:hypothetical protein